MSWLQKLLTGTCKSGTLYLRNGRQFQILQWYIISSSNFGKRQSVAPHQLTWSHFYCNKNIIIS